MMPEFTDKASRIDWLIENKSKLMAQKKATIKHADAISASCAILTEKGETVKSDASPDATKLKVRSVINTTKLLDSHGDVHIDQLWNKSLKESKEHFLVNQHNFTFEGIISDNVHAFVKQIPWSDLGYGGWEGSTQALVFDSMISKEDSPDMFDRYRKGKVKQHSVGMRYVKMELAVNDERYEQEKEIWDKYFPVVANKSEAEELGYFWAILEAKVIEGSAVVRGSNFATPTVSIEGKSEPPQGTQGEPEQSTQKLDVTGLLNHFKTAIKA